MPNSSHAFRRFLLLARMRKGLLVTNLVLGFKSSGEGNCFLYPASMRSMASACIDPIMSSNMRYSSCIFCVLWSRA